MLDVYLMFRYFIALKSPVVIGANIIVLGY